jgi:predicted outer membrane protein
MTSIPLTINKSLNIELRKLAFLSSITPNLDKKLSHDLSQELDQDLFQELDEELRTELNQML